MRIHRSTLVAAGLVLAVASAARAADDYAIKFERPAARGDKAQVSIKGASQRTMAVSINGQPGPGSGTQQSTVAMEAEREVLKTDKGRPTQVAFKIAKINAKMTKDGNAVALKLPAKDDTLIAEFKDGKTVFSVGTRSITDDEAEVLTTMITLDDPKEVGREDATFGTSDRKKIGDTWKINAEEAAKDIVKMGIGASKEGIDGTMKLLSAIKVGDEPALKVTTDMNVKDIQIPGTEGMNREKSTLHMTGITVLPVDLDKPKIGESLKMEVAFAASMSANGQSISMNVTMTQSREETRTPIK